MADIHDARPPVKVAGVGGGIRVRFDPQAARGALREALDHAFQDLGRLASGAKVLFEAESGPPDPVLVRAMGEYLSARHRIGSYSAAPERRPEPPRPPPEPSPDGPAECPPPGAAPREDGSVVVGGRVRSGQRVVARRHLVVFGDVNPGGEVMAGGDVIVLGSLRGTALAGQPENARAIIFALDFRPTQIQIGGHVAAGFGNSPGKVPEYAQVENAGVVVEDYFKNHPFARLPGIDHR
jgi:septum site-determining protein MinC